jgi:hypothetical protein
MGASCNHDGWLKVRVGFGLNVFGTENGEYEVWRGSWDALMGTAAQDKVPTWWPHDQLCKSAKCNFR